jgi:hypothetical protein
MTQPDGQSDGGDGQPEPETVEPPRAPGGPADRVDRDPDDFPLTTPDQPRSAQVEEQHVPDEIEESEDVDEEEQEDSDASTEEPA